jgi:protein SCO1/2
MMAMLLAAEPPVAELPDWAAKLPTVNASLNALATALLVVGFVLVKRGRKTAHRNVMLAAFSTSVVFLGCYLVYHFALHHYTGTHGKSFPGSGVARGIYFAILISHVILAAIVPVLAIVTIVRGLQADWERHRRIAKITFPIWLYVSITGVVIYLMLYHWPVPRAPS